ncbi:Uncharacterized protein TCM_034756 [Theobroma cacao]|uniref:Uncharacterized protein n=1 Tax=Theobroma cacao TaxID=3641 RepID=A0A061FFW8_THECC|nr:Uncharacterized protein TCM_034756 [Theobroma cacao]
MLAFTQQMSMKIWCRIPAIRGKRLIAVSGQICQAWACWNVLVSFMENILGKPGKRALLNVDIQWSLSSEQDKDCMLEVCSRWQKGGHTCGELLAGEVESRVRGSKKTRNGRHVANLFGFSVSGQKGGGGIVFVKLAKETTTESATPCAAWDPFRNTCLYFTSIRSKSKNIKMLSSSFYARNICNSSSC